MNEKLELITQNVVRITNAIEGGKVVGTGFYMSNGYLITDSHVVDTQGDITVMFADGTSTQATLISNDIPSDIAVLKTKETKALALEWEESAEVAVSDTLYAIGYGLDLVGDASVTKGICSASRKAQDIVYIQTDAAVNGGFSGGPLINEAGKVVGLIALANSNASISMAISERSAVALIESLIVTPRVEYVTGTRPQNALSNMLQEVGIHIGDLYQEEHHWHKHPSSTSSTEGDTTTELSQAESTATTTTITTTTTAPQIESILLSSETMELAPEEQKILSAQVTPSSCSPRDLVWTSSDEAVAEYRAGHVIAKAKGECVITATAPNGVSASCKVIVRVEVVESDKYSENITWTFYEDGTLVISGQGEVADRIDGDFMNPEWHLFREETTAIVVEEGITSLPVTAFAGFERCKSIQLPSTLAVVRHWAFENCPRVSTLVLPKAVSKIGLETFAGNKMDLYYEGSQAEFEQIEKHPQYWDEQLVSGGPEEERENRENALRARNWDSREKGLILYYSETEQEGCWRYVDGVPTKW